MSQYGASDSLIVSSVAIVAAAVSPLKHPAARTLAFELSSSSNSSSSKSPRATESHQALRKPSVRSREVTWEAHEKIHAPWR